ncbi:MAG: chitobiase/beta-hexosaminidase C-terminal domain-containing protein [Candidatus Azobacteroides sp.]|nr:chitobiase/beta-hexosaminidase C-terminal domain-containing protein [Candidatus Azobacteroides sp.]
MPLTEESASLTVSLPETSGMYKNLFLDLIDAGNARKQRFVTTDKKEYTFRGLLTGSKHHIYLKNSNEEVLAEMLDVEITDNDTRVGFSSLPFLHTVSIKVMDKNGTEVTGQTTIRWYSENGTFLVQDANVSGLTENKKVSYLIELNNILGEEYKSPSQQEYTVFASENEITYNLQPIEKVTIRGVVTDEDKQALAEAIVSVSQLLNGKHTKTFMSTTDRYGRYALEVYNDISNITVSVPDYINKNLSVNDFSNGSVLDTVRLAIIDGVTITTNLSYTSAVSQDEIPLKLEGYSNYQNIAYSLYNITKDTPLTNISVQYPSIVLLEPADTGDRIRITATSKSGDFMPVEYVVTIDENEKAIAQIDIIELGAVKVSYLSSENPSNVAILYGPSGEQVKRISYSNQAATFKGLPDGNYTLVSMADSRKYNSILKLSELTTSGLVENTDFVKSVIAIESGIVKDISVSTIPAMDENKLLYTGNNTFFRANKPSIVAGNYITLSGTIDFQENYTNKVSNVKMIIDLPEGCSFVENSVMEGSKVKTNYTLDRDKLIIPLEDYMDQVRFCVIPTQGGNFRPNGFAEFELDGYTIRQPIGEANFTSEDLTLVVPKTVARNSITIRGIAIAKSEIEVYDNTVLIGKTVALANGSWSLEGELYKPYNLSSHTIHATVTTPQNIRILTEAKKVTYNINAIEVSKVTMINIAHPATSSDLCEYITEFDFQNPKSTLEPYWYWPEYPEFTFKIDFTNNDPEYVSDVTLYVSTSSGDIVPIPASYDQIKDIWLAKTDFESHSLPVNLSVDYLTDKEEALLDNDFINEYYALPEQITMEYVYNVQFIDSISALLEEEMKKEVIDTKRLNELRDELDIFMGGNGYSNKEIDTTIYNYLSSLSKEDLISYMESSLQKTNSLLAEAGNLNFDSMADASIYDVIGDFEVTTCEKYVESELVSQGFVSYPTTDGHTVYLFTSEDEFIYIDFRQNICLTTTHVGLKNSNGLREDIQILFEFISRINGFISNVNDIFEVSGRDLESVAKLFKELITGIDLQIAEESAFLQMYSNHPEISLEYDLVKQQEEALNALLIKKELLQTGLNTAEKISATIKTISFLTHWWNMVTTLYDYTTLYINVPNPCEKQPAEADNIRRDIIIAGTLLGGYGVATCLSDIVALGGFSTSLGLAIPTGGASLPPALVCILKIAAGYGITQVINWTNKQKQLEINRRIDRLECIKDDDKDKDNNNDNDEGNGNGGGKSGKSGSGDAPFVMDPSGYVYEAVPDNRLSGATTTIYYKTWEENMYGDREEKIVLWDASEYSQENPLVTDEYGLYGWDVPSGEWQVKYEKEGYETTYSEWLPVPPPQLDVNIGMVQNTQPYVQAVMGYESGIEVIFDKFMMPATLTTFQIVVTRNGILEAGAVELLNAESNPYNKDEEFASTVRFVPYTPFAITDQVIISVSRKVMSYAGISMENDFMQQVEIMKEAKSILVVPSIEIEYNGRENLVISVAPSEAAAGKKIMGRSASPAIATITEEAILDKDGRATLTVNAELSGTTVLTISLEGMNLKTEVIAKVGLPKPANQLSKPTASVDSGTTLPINSFIELFSDTEDARILYTIDETAPDKNNGIEYTEPILLTKNIIIKAIAVKEGMADSEVATFQYFIQNGAGINPVGDNEVRVYAKNQTLYIRGLKEQEVYTIYSLLGNIVTQGIANNGQEQQITLPAQGIYIISTLRKKIKILVE